MQYFLRSSDSKLVIVNLWNIAWGEQTLNWRHVVLAFMTITETWNIWGLNTDNDLL